ncbi:MAG: hypothetical protein IKN28_02885 [Firmicutes bacterium]|nr:hypothetical protein [Bacillota bacterium]
MALIKFYKKNDFEKKTTRERYRIERGELYFRKKSGSTVAIMFAFAVFAFFFARRETGGGPFYYAVAVAFAAIAVWQIFYVRGAKVGPEEVDERLTHMRDSIELETDALNTSDMDYDAFMAAEKISVYGYTALPVQEEEAILRADRSDDVGRSSHMQFTCFILGEDHLEAYSTVRTLFGEEKKTPLKESTIMEWFYSQIRQVGFERLAADCAVEAGSEKTELRKFPVISIRSSNKRENRTYAICEDCRSDAEALLSRVREKIEQEKE